MPAHTRGGPNLAVLAGAGVSVGSPSCLPAAEALKTTILKSLVPDDIRDKVLDRASLAKFEEFPLELLLETLHSRLGMKAFQPLTALLGGKQSPNDAHLAIADLAKAGLTGFILTVNFDELIERALQMRGLEPGIHYTTRMGRLTRNELLAMVKDSRVNVIKLHGTISTPRSLVATLRDVGGGRVATPALRTLLRFLGQDCRWLVSGYRGSDPDLKQMLQEELSRDGVQVTWNLYGGPGDVATWVADELRTNRNWSKWLGDASDFFGATTAGKSTRIRRTRLAPATAPIAPRWRGVRRGDLLSAAASSLAHIGEYGKANIALERRRLVDPEPSVQAEILIKMGQHLGTLGLWSQAWPLYEEAKDLLVGEESNESRVIQASLYLALGKSYWDRGFRSKCLRFLRRGYRIACEVRGPNLSARASFYRFVIPAYEAERLSLLGRPKLALKRLSLAEAEVRGHIQLDGVLRRTRGLILKEMGSFAEAAQELTASLPLLLADINGQIQTHNALAEVALAQGDPRAALSHATTAESLAREIGSDIRLAQAQFQSARAMFALGMVAEALKSARASAELAKRVGDPVLARGALALSRSGRRPGQRRPAWR